MIHSIAATYHWPPKEYESLYLDDADFFGIFYWYDEIVRDAADFEKKRQKIKQEAQEKARQRQ